MLPFSILRLYPVGLVKPQLADNKHTGQVLSLSLCDKEGHVYCTSSCRARR